MENRRFIEHETHVDIEEFINGVWAVTQCNVVLSEKKYMYEGDATQKNLQAVKAYYYRNKEKILKRQKDKPYIRYKISSDEYNALKTRQNGKCAICGKEKKLVIDHNHDTGKVRGLLCTGCNVGIGLLQDSAEVLDKAKKYLSEN